MKSKGDVVGLVSERACRMSATSPCELSLFARVFNFVAVNMVAVGDEGPSLQRGACGHTHRTQSSRVKKKKTTTRRLAPRLPLFLFSWKLLCGRTSTGGIMIAACDSSARRRRERRLRSWRRHDAWSVKATLTAAVNNTTTQPPPQPPQPPPP